MVSLKRLVTSENIELQFSKYEYTYPTIMGAIALFKKCYLVIGILCHFIYLYILKVTSNTGQGKTSPNYLEKAEGVDVFSTLHLG
jgi:hypothetical protein